VFLQGGSAPNGQDWSSGIGTGLWCQSWSIQNVESGLYVDVYGASLGAGATIDAWYGNGDWNQSFLDFTS
jgi:hypothetical protein